MGRTLDSRLPILLRAVSPRGEPDLIEAPDDEGSGRIVLADNASPESLARAAERLAPDGLLAVSGPRPALEDMRLSYRGSFLRSNRALVHASPAARALHAEQSALSGPRRVALRLAPSALVPQVALFTRRDGPRPLAWLDSAAGPAALVASHRSSSVAVRLADVDLFAKWATPAEHVERAHENETAFAAGARIGGFDVPQSRMLELGDAAALVTNARSGETAAALLQRRPGELAPFADRLTSTLEAWNLRSRTFVAFGATTGARQLVGDLEVVGSHLRAGDVEAVQREIERASEQHTPVAPAHGDVSMWNLVIGPAGLTLVDWEAALPGMLPGFDAEYALVDAVAAASGYRDRVAAFTSSDVERLRQRVAATTEMPPSVARLAAVACWAHHAANEARAGGSDGSFLAILRLVLAARRT